MIDANTDHIYNILLSIVLGVIVVLFIDQLFTTPQVVKIDQESV